MPYKDPATKREYHREYMRRKRAVVKPDKEEGLPLISNVPVPQLRRRQMSRVLDRTRPYTVERRYPWPAYLVQDGLWFDPNTEKVVGAVR